MGKREEDQGTRAIRCALGILLGGALALGVCLLFLLCIITPALASWFMLVRLSPLQLLCAGAGIIVIPLVQKGLFYVFERLMFVRPDLT